MKTTARLGRTDVSASSLAISIQWLPLPTHCPLAPGLYVPSMLLPMVVNVGRDDYVVSVPPCPSGPGRHSNYICSSNILDGEVPVHFDAVTLLAPLSPT